MSNSDVPRTELDMQEELTNLLLGAEEEGFEIWEIASVNSFSEAGVMTNNKGLVVALRNGAEFQVTIVQSRSADDAAEEDEDDHGPGCDGPLNCTCTPDGLCAWADLTDEEPCRVVATTTVGFDYSEDGPGEPMIVPLCTAHEQEWLRRQRSDSGQYGDDGPWRTSTPASSARGTGSGRPPGR